MFKLYSNLKILTILLAFLQGSSILSYAADVGVSTYALNATIFNGQTPTFSVSAHNYSSSGTATNVVVQITNPATDEASYVTAYPSIGSYDATSGQWIIPFINASSTVTLNIVYKIKKSGTLSFSIAKTASTDFDNNIANNYFYYQFKAYKTADVDVSQTVKPGPYNLGSILWFKIVAKNNGPDSAINTIVRNFLPKPFVYSSYSLKKGTYNPSTGEWKIGNMANGEKDTLILYAKIDASNIGGTDTGKIYYSTYSPFRYTDFYTYYYMPKFRTDLGTLVKANFNQKLNFDNTFIMENVGPSKSKYKDTLTYTGILNAAGLANSSSVSKQVFGSGSLSSYDGVFDFGGTSGKTIRTIDSAQQDASYTTSLSTFSGSGNFIVRDPYQVSSFLSASGGNFVSGFMTQGYIKTLLSYCFVYPITLRPYGNVSVISSDSWDSVVSSNNISIPIIDGALPVTLTSFKVDKSKLGNELKWTTAQEENNSGFELERSIDGINFSKIGFVVGNGTTQNINNYQFIDQELISLNQPIVYYRLKQIDYNNKFEYSPIVRILNSKKPNEVGILITQNNITLNSSILTVNNISLFDIQGRIIGQAKEQNSISIPVNVNGILIMSAQMSDGSIINKKYFIRN